MIVVLDANVILAALMTEGLCHALLEQCISDHHLCMSESLLEEIVKKLEKKFDASPRMVAQTHTWLLDVTHAYVPTVVSPQVCRDPKDAHILGLAAASHADCLVTGDKDLLVLKEFREIPIFSPREFYTFLQKKHH